MPSNKTPAISSRGGSRQTVDPPPLSHHRRAPVCSDHQPSVQLFNVPFLFDHYSRDCAGLHVTDGGATVRLGSGFRCCLEQDLLHRRVVKDELRGLVRGSGNEVAMVGLLGAKVSILPGEFMTASIPQQVVDSEFSCFRHAPRMHLLATYPVFELWLSF